MTEETIRTAVLAREGEARDRIVQGLGEAGADVVGVIDPAIADPQHVRDLDPGAIVVALEPAIEDALERYAGVFSDPAITVIFEEASVVIVRSGWDAARWVRHLSAKLRRHVDVLPPSLQPQTDDVVAADAGAGDDGIASGVLSLDLDDDTAATSTMPLADGSAHAFDPVAFEHDESGVVPTIELDPDLGAGLSLVEDDEDGDGEATRFLQIRDDETPAPDLDAALAVWSVEASDADVDDLEQAVADAVDALPTSTAPESGDDIASAETRQHEAAPLTLSLTDVAALPSFAVTSAATVSANAAPNAAVHRDLDALEARISGLSLADTDSYGSGPVRGAVLVEGGLGGPDAVRQLLAAIPEGFPRPILVRLHLDGGRYDRLVRQMERAAVLPVSLAEAGNEIADGEIHFVTPDLDIVRSGGRLRFVAADAAEALPEALPADDSAMLFLSGSDVALVDAAMGPGWQGALVAGQSPDSCYDATAAEAAIARGSASGTPGELADILVARWMPGGRADSHETGGLSL